MKRSLTTIALAMFVCAAAASAFAQGLLRDRLRQNRLGRPMAGQQPAQAPAEASGGGAAAAGKTVEPGGRSIEFSGAPVEMVLKVYGDLVDKTVIKDPAAPSAAITLQPKQGQELSDEDKILAIETVLEMNGVHLEPYGEKFVRALPRATARKEGIPLLLDPDAALGDSSRVVSLMMSFRNIALEEAQKALEGLKSDKGVLNVYERSGSILVTDTEMNLARMREVIKEIDIPTPVTENVFIRQIQNANATDIQKVLQEIVEDAKKIQERQGKNAQNNVRGASGYQPPGGMRTLLGRPHQQQNAPAPKQNESLVTAVSDADRGMIRGDSLIIADERSNKLVIKTQKANMDFFDKVIEQLDVETTPDTVVKVYRLKYADAEDVQDMINDLIGNAPSGKNSKQGSQNANSKNAGNQKANLTSGSSAQKKSANQRTGDAKAGELSKENTTVLADKRINGIVVMTQKELVPVVEQIIESMDIKLSQVLIETCIIEVALGHDLQSGIDWVQKGRQHKTKVGEKLTDSLGRQLYYPYAKTGTGEYSSSIINYGGTPVLAGTEGASSVEALRNVAEVARDGLLNYYSGGAYGMGGGASGGSEALGVATRGATNLLSKSFSFVFDSDELGLSAILHMAETDNRAKYIASPIVMTVDNKEATIDATENRQFVTGWTAQSGSYGNSGQPTPNYSAKDIGIKLKITPKINPNGTVMLNVEEEYSQLVPDGQSMLIPKSDGGYTSGTVDLARERKMSADVLLEDNQTVVFGGLTETATSESEKGIPFLKDIPWIGKWLFSETTQTEDRKELLVFLTPYVLNDAQSAQAEAQRRKNTLPDARPWDDLGWSKSALADPVTGKEKLRKQKDEWKKQDEDHESERALDKARMERVLQLKARDIEERKSREKEDKKLAERLAELEKKELELKAEQDQQNKEAPNE